MSFQVIFLIFPIFLKRKIQVSKPGFIVSYLKEIEWWLWQAGLKSAAQ